MADFIGALEIPHIQVLKHIWKIIICDNKKIFGGKHQVGFLEDAGLINPQLLQ
ncbi:hypothetical protein P3X46_014031 [Hevea brasiliensis]|uniref:EH domain-containing protein n=1 Tax=Hevea brasiliensis TaxID=3981 RepID=A0ABQ9M5L1_HEVBR|nr:hypothetical protein P3X46_014031 [Hevea brasiliensis]